MRVRGAMVPAHDGPVAAWNRILGALTQGASGVAAMDPGLAVRHASARVGDVDVFYREAGAPDAPVILLLHGFANSSFYFRHLMRSLRDEFRLVAPDLPSFGFTTVVEGRGYRYDFDALSRTLAGFVEALDLDRYALYLFDYGAPIGFDLAMAHPDRVSAIISQNGNAYLEGLDPKVWGALQTFWADGGEPPREAIKSRMTAEGVKATYVSGVPDPSVIEPESYTLDAAILALPGRIELQVDLRLDYKRNLERYADYQAYFRSRRPKLLAIWGRHDPVFAAAGAEAFRRDVPSAEVILLETGHFALETHGEVIAAEMRHFLLG